MKTMVKAIDLRDMKLKLFTAFVVAAAMLLTACTGNTNSNVTKEGNQSMMDDNKGTQSYNTKNDFMLPDTDGNQYKLSLNDGKPVYIKFWATWCPICLSGINELSQLDEEKKNGDVAVITIVSPGAKGEMNTEDFIEWYKKQGYSFKVLLDEEGAIAGKFGIRGYPTSVFIDGKGNIVKTQVGHVSNSDINSILDSII